MIYVIRPKTELLDMLKQYSVQGWNKPCIWVIPNNAHVHDESNELFVKYLFLVDQIALEKHRPEIDRIIPILFDDPPKLNIKAFDRWWTAKRPDRVIACETLMEDNGS